MADAPKVIQRRQAFEDTAKALEGDVKTDSPAADLKKPPHLELKAGGDSTAPPSASPLKTAVPKSPQPPPMLWEKRRLPIIAADQQDLTGWTVLGEAYEQ